MVSERYRCANYSDLEDEEDEADFAYESEEEEFSNPKKEEDDSVSEVVEISHCEFTFGSFGQESTLDIVHAIPIKTVKPKIEGCTVKIGQITCSFNTIKSETCYDDSFSFLEPKTKAEKYKTEKYSKNVPPSTNQFRRSCLELGNLLSPIVVSSPAAIVECVNLVYAKASGISSFTFDPGGASMDVASSVKSHIESFSDFTAAFPPLARSVLLSFSCCDDTLDFNFGDPPHLIASPPYTAPLHNNFVFDRGKPPLIADRIRLSVFPLSTVVICVKPEEHPILVFDPGGNFISFSVCVMFPSRFQSRSFSAWTCAPWAFLLDLTHFSH